MANLSKWNPYDELQRMREDFGQMFGSAFPWVGRDTFQTGNWGPSVDMNETETHFHMSAEVPGVNPEDIDLTITEEGITLRGEVQKEEDATETGYRRIERRYGSFQRTIPFPVAVQYDQAQAEYRNGILQITVPKADPGKSKAIRLQVNTEPNDRH